MNELFQKSLYNVMSDVLLFAFSIKLNISTKNRVKKLGQGSYIVNSSDLCNAIKKILDTISCHRRFHEATTRGNKINFQVG